VETVDCILCERSEVELFKEENGYRAVRCKVCGLVFVSPRPSIHEMKALYEDQETKVDLHRHLASRDTKTAEARRALATIRRHVPHGGRLLELGSAAGYLLWEAKHQGFDVQGLDLTHQFVEFARNVLGVPAFEGTLRDATFADASFDVIYHRNLMSHLAWPLEEHRILHRLLRPGGYIVFETGNAAELAADDAGELELPDHLFHFSESTIVKLLQASGFTWVETRRHTLIDQLAPVRKGISAITNRLPVSTTGPRTGARRPLRPLPTRLPPSRWTTRLKAAAHQFLRYDVGTWLPHENQRCTLVVVARRAL